MKARVKKTAQVASPASLLTGWARQGVQSFVAAQKILMDLAAQENALLIGMVKEGFTKPGTRLSASVAGIVEKGVEHLAAAGKILLDLVADETALAVDGVKEGLRLPAPAGAMAEVARHRIGTFIDMQKNLLDATADQAHAVSESYREGERLSAAGHVTELARRGIEAFVENEKKFLDLAVQEIGTATKGHKRTQKPPRDRMDILTTVARAGAEKYIETQRKLMDLAIEQLEDTAKASRQQLKERARKEALPSFRELTEKSMKNFVSAEKSLLDLATKPMKKPAGEAIRKAPRHARTRRSAKKHATGMGAAVAHSS